MKEVVHLKGVWKLESDLTCAVSVSVLIPPSDNQLDLITFNGKSWVHEQSGPVYLTVVEFEISNVAYHNSAFRVEVKITLIWWSCALQILSNLCVVCWVNCKLFCDTDIKCEWKGDVLAEVPGDLHCGGACMETKKRMQFRDQESGKFIAKTC